MTLTAPPVTEPPRPVRRRWPLVAVITSLIALGLAVIALAMAADKDTGDHAQKGSGVAASETRTVAGFTGIELAGALKVNVVVGGAQRVVVHADDNLLSRVSTDVRSGTLVVGTDGNFTSDSPMYVEVTAPALAAAELSGAGQLEVSGVTAGAFAATLSGTGVLKASGHAGDVEATASGAGDLQLGTLVAKQVTVTLTGTGRAAVHATASLDATLSGTGTITYVGSPAKVTTDVSGTGAITAG